MNIANDSTARTLASTIGLAEVLALVRRQFWLITLVTAALALVAVVYLSTVAPRYSAKALLMIDSRANAVNLESVINGLAGDPETVMSEIEVLKSTRLADLVIQELELHNLAEFNETLRPPGVVDNLLGAGANQASAAGDGGLAGAQTRVPILRAFLNRLSVEPRPGSRVVAVSFSSQDPQVAADVANTLSELYLRDQLESKFEAVQRATAWLSERVSSLRTAVDESERSVEEFRERSGLLEGGGTTLTDQEVSQLNSEVLAASSARAAASAQLSQVRRLMSVESGAESIGNVLKSPLIQRLREQEVRVLRQVAELATEYGERHPTMIKLRAEAADIRTKIDAEIGKVISGLESDLRVARTREYSVIAKLEAAKQRVGENNKSLVTLRSLEREAEANRLLLETMLARFTETSAQDDLASQRPDARIIAHALVPDEPSYPMKKAILALVLVSGAFLGLMLAFARELMDDTIRSGEQVEAVTGLRYLGFVPALSRRTLGGQMPADYMLDQPLAAYSESIRTIVASLARIQDDGSSQTLLVTSGEPDDGKSTTCVALARAFALTGKRVIIVDADCRNLTLAKMLQVDGDVGLADVLLGKASLADAIVKDPRSPAHVLCAGQGADNPPALLSSANVKVLITRLVSRYDVVIFDSPPTMAVSDALILSAQVDRTVLVTRWGVTRRATIARATQQLTDAGATMAGAVVSRVNTRKYARYGYADSGAYAGKMARYYAA